MPFIGYKKQIISYSDYIIQKLNDRELLLNLIDSYQHLLFSVELLINNSICHFDLNENNILFSQKRNTPLIIDFGLSIPMTTLTAENYSKYFYIYIPEYYYWPLEVHYINFLLHESSEPTYQDIVIMAQRYMKDNTPLTQNFSKSFLQKFETACVEILDDYRLKSVQVKDLLSFWQSWDNYALSIMYLRILFYLNITEDGVAYTENTFVSSFTTILLQNIHPDASRRLTIQETRDKFSTFFYNPAVNKVGNYENILENLSENKKRLHRVVLEDKEELLKLEKRYTKHNR
jgi:serine/threonine protein kinase